MGEGGTSVSLSEVVQQLEGLAKTQGLSLSSSRTDEEVDSSVLVYNLAVARFQQRHMLQSSQLASRLLPLPASLPHSFARKILFLHCELSLALHQPEQALAHASKLEEMLGELQREQGDSLSTEQARVLVLKARCSVMARLTKTLKKVTMTTLLIPTNIPIFLGTEVSLPARHAGPDVRVCQEPH